MKILHLSLKKEPFEVMVTGEKQFEYRAPSHWVLSRIDGKLFDLVKFTNGYGPDKPYFIAKYKGWYRSRIKDKQSYSNGLTVDITIGTICISIGKIIETGNLK